MTVRYSPRHPHNVKTVLTSYVMGRYFEDTLLANMSVPPSSPVNTTMPAFPGNQVADLAVIFLKKGHISLLCIVSATTSGAWLKLDAYHF